MPRRPRLRIAVGAAALSGGLLLASAAPGLAAEALLPPEDRAAIARSAAAAEQRLYDLLPPGAVASAGAAEATEDPGVRRSARAARAARAPVADGGDEGSAPVADEAEAAGSRAPAEAVVHVLAPGESLADVAARHGITGHDGWRRLFDANPEIADPDVVSVGTHVRIPAPEEELARRDLPAPPPPPVRGGGGGGGGSGGGVWDRLAGCESGGSWGANTGNGYYGGLQFSASSWRAVGGSGLPHEHSRGTQIAMGERLRAAQGWGAWPSCSRRLGLR